MNITRCPKCKRFVHYHRLEDGYFLVCYECLYTLEFDIEPEEDYGRILVLLCTGNPNSKIELMVTFIVKDNRVTYFTLYNKDVVYSGQDMVVAVKEYNRIINKIYE